MIAFYLMMIALPAGIILLACLLAYYMKEKKIHE